MKTLWPLLLIWLAVVNSISLLAMGMDKFKARRGAWRIPERRIWLLAWLGGSPGAWLGMQVFRHKTRHPAFSIGLPVLAILQILLLAWLLVTVI